MVDLEAISGLPIKLDDAGLLVFGMDVVVDEHGERLFDALTPVALDPDACRGNQSVAYYMDNGVYLREDASRLADVPMRYELTLVPPGRLGREMIKTHGHRHCPEPRSGLDYVEICEVLTGTAHFLMQTLELDGPDAPMVFLLEANPGDKIILPPGLDHCTINPGAEPLLFSDVIARGVSGIYDRFTETRGAAYLEVSDNGEPHFIPNPSYRNVAPMEVLRAEDYPELDLTRDRPLYTAFLDGLGERWAFLNDPRLFDASFPDLAALVAK
ncbi:MAG: hypothetical protein GX620_11215 [Chloroflexi bacterium]|nr:hypothetical protein [Chloroflexota bacterium]